ncbi:MAG: chemotaxis protein CheY [candidate division Zixibacteria bacterium SM23_81]|nr:MAG: chemotaxis protein CheY [candidate division Zixibacteria bacterium SM23_81]
MKQDRKPFTILIADDDPDDRLMVKETWEDNLLANGLVFVEDGEELMDYLYRRGKYVQLKNSPFPGLILLDLNMPKKNGREALKEIKADPDLRQIPVVVLTTSRAEEDIYRAYNLGVNSFITKPLTFETFVHIIKTIGKFWLEIVELPTP